MKIKSLQISNILSFKYYSNVSNAEKLTFDDGLNIIIGENGSGKSTALEIINFLFKQVFYRQYNCNEDLFSRRNTISEIDRKQTLMAANSASYRTFRLGPNWDSMGMPQTIRIEIELDGIDIKNIQNLESHIAGLNQTAMLYTNRAAIQNLTHQNTYTVDVTLNPVNGTHVVNPLNGASDFGFHYLGDYNFYKESIRIYNILHPEGQIEPLAESFVFISGYRNYHAFDPAVSLKDQPPSQQMQQIRVSDYLKSLNTGEQAEPPIFKFVRLRVAERHFGLFAQKFDAAECEIEANKLPFISSINDRLKIINLECKIQLLDQRTWQYSFVFRDTRNGKTISDVNSLSAGQKSILHLVFEAYGKGDLKGGLVIIDEPEIHLHYQFQNEYLQVIKELNKHQQCQYILVTHSETLINSSTINRVRRFSLNKEGHTEFKSPKLTISQKMLIKILDNTRSTYAFFAKKVLLVEGDTDRYFFKSVLQEKYSDVDQQIAVLDIGGKGNFQEWGNLFEAFGLTVYRVADFDFVVESFYPTEKATSLKTTTEIIAFKQKYPDWEARIESEYAKRTFILKNGDLEVYLGIIKGLPKTIEFCNQNLNAYLADDTNQLSLEIRRIVEQVIA